MIFPARPLKAERLTYVPVIEAARPRDGLCKVDRWWAVVQHLGEQCIVFYDGQPQCNSFRHVAEPLFAELYPGCTVQQLPVIYIGPPREEY